LYAEGLSRRDSVKAAQYEVLENDAKKPSLKTLTQHFVPGYFRQLPAPKADISFRGLRD
jgi:hypothetical protein